MINEIKLDSDVLLFKYYIIRDNKLNYTNNLNDVFIDEKYCHFYKSPSIPHELILFLHSKYYLNSIMNSNSYFQID
jgi:hypothetical protein